MSKGLGWIVYVFLATLVVLGAIRIYGPTVETQFWPVYSRFTIVEVKATKEGKTSAVFSFAKYRECEPQGFAWYAGDIGVAYRQLDVEVIRDLAQPAIRPLGQQISSTYVIDVDLDIIRSGVFAEVFSRCHPFWTTRSVIFP